MLSYVNNGIDTFDRRWSLWSDIFAEILINVLIVKHKATKIFTHLVDTVT